MGWDILHMRPAHCPFLQSTTEILIPVCLITSEKSVKPEFGLFFFSFVCLIFGLVSDFNLSLTSASLSVYLFSFSPVCKEPGKERLLP